MTCCGDRQEHAVTDHQFAAGAMAGTYRTICGHTAAPASLSSPPGARCAGCLVELTGTAPHPHTSAPGPGSACCCALRAAEPAGPAVLALPPPPVPPSTLTWRVGATRTGGENRGTSPPSCPPSPPASSAPSPQERSPYVGYKPSSQAIRTLRVVTATNAQHSPHSRPNRLPTILGPGDCRRADDPSRAPLHAPPTDASAGARSLRPRSSWGRPPRRAAPPPGCGHPAPPMSSTTPRVVISGVAGGSTPLPHARRHRLRTPAVYSRAGGPLVRQAGEAARCV